MIRTPGMIGRPGKWPWKNGSLNVTFLMPTALSSGTRSTSLSINRNGYRCGKSSMIWRISRSGADPFCSTESISLLVLLSSHTIERSSLTVPLHQRNRRAAADGPTGRHVAGDAALAADPGAIADREMADDPGLAADRDHVAQTG